MMMHRLRALGRQAVVAPLVSQRTGAARAFSAAGGSPVKWSGLAVAGVVGSGLAYYYITEKTKRQTQATKKQVTHGRPKLGGPWTLVDSATGKGVTDSSYRGSFTLMYFGFCHCPDICPAELLKMGEIVGKLQALKDKAPKLEPIFVSIDGPRDTIGQLEYYAKDFDAAMHFLVGTPQQVASACKAYRVYQAQGVGEGTDDYLLDHSIVLYLNDKNGNFLDFFTQSTPQSEVVQRILEHHKDALAQEKEDAKNKS